MARKVSTFVPPEPRREGNRLLPIQPTCISNIVPHRGPPILPFPYPLGNTTSIEGHQGVVRRRKQRGKDRTCQAQEAMLRTGDSVRRHETYNQ